MTKTKQFTTPDYPKAIKAKKPKELPVTICPLRKPEISEELDMPCINSPLKDAMIELINKSAEFKESFVFERLQDYMDLSDLKNPKWTSNVRIRMLEITEGIAEGRRQALAEVEKKIDKLILPEKEGKMNDTTYKYFIKDFIKSKLKGIK